MGFLTGKKSKTDKVDTSSSVNKSDSFTNSESYRQDREASGSYNANREAINAIYQPQGYSGQRASRQLDNLMGLNGPNGSQEAADGYRNFQNSTGYQNIFDEAMRGVTGSSAARGLLNSGSAAKALQDRGTNIAQQSFGNYLGQLNGQVNSGIQAGGLLSSSGGVSASRRTSDDRSRSNSVSSSSGSSQGMSVDRSTGGTKGIFGDIASAAGRIYGSDIRLKKNIKKVGQLSNGLNLYDFEYKEHPGIHKGVMAHEVAEIQPEALGPIVNGYATVDYGKIDNGI